MTVVLVSCLGQSDARRVAMAPRSMLPRALVPVSIDTARSLLGPNPTREQLKYHWGSLGRIFEKVSVSWLGPLFMATLNDMSLLGGLEATVLGSLAASYFVWGPAVAAFSRGSLTVTRSSSAAVFFGRISSLRERVDDGNVRVLELVVDDGTPELRFVIWAPWRDEYKAIALGLRARLLVLRSGTGRFSKTTLVSDCYLPRIGVYFGDYPDLNREEFELLVSRIEAEIPTTAFAGEIE